MARSIDGPGLSGAEPVARLRGIPSWSRDSILTDVDHLKPYVQTAEHVYRLIERSHSVAVSTEISVRIHQWVMNTSSEALWIEGPSGPAQPSQSTL
ncbi:hypothetical protein OIDMADRAFT_117829, partial [Oidiodendron maius Zn]